MNYFYKLHLFFFILIVLTSCSGGGGSSGISSGSGTCSYTGSTYSGCYPARQQPSSYETSEYQYNYGVGDSNSSDAYSRELTGEGTVVAIFDSGINTSHNEFSGKNISGYNYQDSNTTIQDQNGHGTHVAGIISANKDDTGMHGIAYGVTSIQSYQILKDSDGFFVGAGTNTVIPDAANKAINANVKVANHSWGGPYDVNSVSKSAIEAAYGAEVDGYESMVSNNIIQVWATGNSESTQPSIRPGLPYHYSNLKELWIAVMAIDTNGNEASFANRCGVAADWCISAPGVSILSTDEDNNSGYTNLSGTSMAAPHVTGAIAILIETFPTLSAEQIVDRLLTTASTEGLTDIYGNSYSSAVFGHGKLDLDSATKPIEVLALSSGSSSLSNSKFYNINTSGIKFSTAFGSKIIKGNKITKNSGLDNLFAGQVAVFDSFDNATFYMNLNSFVNTSEYINSELLNSILFNDVYEKRVLLSSNLYIDFIENNNYSNNISSSNPDKNYFYNFTLNYRRNSMNFEYNYSYSSDFYFLTADREMENIYIDNALSNPLISMNGKSQSLTLSKAVTNKLSYNLFIERQIPYDEYKDHYNQDDSYIASTKIEYKNQSNVISTEYGVFYEPTSFLGSLSSGAFKINESNTTFIFLELDSSVKGYRILANYFHANTKVDISTDSMYSNFKKLSSSSWSLGVEKLISNNGKEFIRFLSYQPIRVNNGSFQLNIPKYADMFGNIYSSYVEYDLEPNSREINYEISYNKKTKNIDYKIGTLMIRNGGHIKSNNSKIFLLEVKKYL